MPSVIGLLFLGVSLYLFFREDDSLFGLVIVSSIFAASSVIDAEEHGIQPYYLVAAIFVVQSVLRGRIGIKTFNSFKGKGWMMLFAVIGIASAFILPIVFGGTPVYDPYIGIDQGLLFRPPLHLSLANFTQSAYLLLDVLVVIGASQALRSGGSPKKAYMFAFYFLAGTVFLQCLCSAIGVQFPYFLLQNHGGYGLQDVQIGEWSSRFPGTFTESSGAGLVLATFTAGFLAERLKYGRSLFPILTGLFAIFLVRSSASMAAVGITFVALLVAHPIFQFPYWIKTEMLRRCALLILIVAVALALVAFSPIGESIVTQSVGKQESSSFVNRTASDLYSLELVVVTKGLGVGMGSNRPSSLITSLLSTVGVIGFVVFLLTYFKLLANAAREISWLQWAGFALFVDLVLAGPDFTMPWIWVILAYAVQRGTLLKHGLLEPAGA